jgi:hypothetical protein
MRPAVLLGLIAGIVVALAAPYVQILTRIPIFGAVVALDRAAWIALGVLGAGIVLSIRQRETRLAAAVSAAGVFLTTVVVASLAFIGTACLDCQP